MTSIVGDTACPGCRSQGRDSTGDHLIIFKDGHTYCKRCHYKEPKGTRDEKGNIVNESAKEERKRGKKTSGITMAYVAKLESDALLSRGIDWDIAERYGVKIEYNGATGEEKAYYYPIEKSGKILDYHVRVLPKTFYRVESNTKGKKIDLFGQSTCRGKGKRLLIVEAQDDVLAACQMLYRRYPKYKPDVVGSWGGATLKVIGDNLDWINGYDEIILCMDADEAGGGYSEEAAKLIGPKARIMDLPDGYDPNDMLKEGKEKDFISAFFEAKAYVPDSILTVDDVYEEAREMPTWGRLWPWPTLNRLTYGRREGGGIYVGAAVKAGKSKWLTRMVRHIIENDGTPTFLVSFEKSPAQVVKEIAGEMVNQIFTKPDGDFTQEELEDAISLIKDHLILFDASFTDVGQSNMWDRLKPAIRHAVLVMGSKDVFIDPITQLTDGMTSSETETELRRFSNELAGMAKDLGFFYYCFAHLKEPDKGKTHEEGGFVKVAQFRGSRAMAEKTKLMLGIIRNQYADDPVERNTSTHWLLLNSGFGKTGHYDVYYDDETGEFDEVDERDGI